jgi:hypothetical protein
MRKYIKIAVLGAVLLAGSSCKKFLDVNDNPNSPTSSTPNIVLPAAILQAGRSTIAFDNFGAWTAGYKANAGGYGGFGTQWTYEFTSTDYNNMWNDSFAAINQFNFVISNTDATGPLKYYNAIARVMKGWTYQRLVDQYGDVPYSDAGQGVGKLSPKYDTYDAVYKAVYADLDAAIAVMATAPVTNVTTAVTGAQDPMFGGSSAASLARWTAFANTVKLKMLIRAQKVAALSSWVATAKASLPTTSAGYLTDDAIINPGFNSATASQMSPKWTAFAWDINGTSITAGLSSIPTPFILSFYQGGKITDNDRGRMIYASFGTNITQTIGLTSITFVGPSTNQLGFDVDPVKRGVAGSYWYSGLRFGTTTTRLTGTNANAGTDIVGVLKGASMGLVAITGAESYLLQAEAALPSVALITGTPKALFESGIQASFQYLGKNAAGTYIHTTPSLTLKTNYVTANVGNRLVNYDLAVSEADQLEAIITQKYIAVNLINSEEGYNEFRRTGFPTIVPGSTTATETFASLKAPNNLPARVLYPATEFQVNSENVPKGITPKTKLFYAK